MLTRHTRREFFRRASAVGVGAWIATGVPAWGENRSANEKLNIGVIGANGRGKANLDAVGETENIVALCDVDELRLSESAAKHPGAARYADFRKMLETEQLDAVIVSDMDRTLAFYRDLLGMTIADEKGVDSGWSDDEEQRWNAYHEKVCGIPGAKIKVVFLAAPDGSQLELVE